MGTRKMDKNVKDGKAQNFYNPESHPLQTYESMS